MLLTFLSKPGRNPVRPGGISKMKDRKIIFFFLTLVSGVVLLYPLLDFQYFIASGDHGRDLYAFKRTLEGGLPYQDYFWPFGPLMPYYYALFNLVFGVSIQSVVLGQVLLVLGIGLLVYLTSAVFVPAPLAFICAFWYWSFREMEFFYTYNHAGGLLALMLVVFFLFHYIKNSRKIFIFGGAFGILLLCLIRLNIGLSSLAAFILCLLLSDIIKKQAPPLRHLRLYMVLTCCLLALTGLIYWALIHPLPSYAIEQCFPYRKSSRLDATTGFGNSLVLLLRFFWASAKLTWASRVTSLAILTGPLALGFFLKKNNCPLPEKKQPPLVLLSLLIFMLFNFHEFLASGVFYRVYWIFPLFITSIFYLFYAVYHYGPPKIFTPLVGSLVMITMFFSAFFHIRSQHLYISAYKIMGNRFLVGNNNIYVCQQPSWITTVKQTHDYLQTHLKKEEKFFAVPFDPLFYYLTGKMSPSRQLIFFKHNNIPEEQEQEIIRKLDENHVHYIVFSNRWDSPSEGLGTFGKDCCQLLAQYIHKNFETVAVFGDWVNPPGWAWNYGVKILKRK